MDETATRSPARNDLYEADFYEWTQEQARGMQPAVQEPGQILHCGQSADGGRLLDAAGVRVAPARKPGVGQEQRGEIHGTVHQNRK